MSGCGGESGWGDGDLGGRVCPQVERHKDAVASHSIAWTDQTMVGVCFPNLSRVCRNSPAQQQAPCRKPLPWQSSPPAASFPLSVSCGQNLSLDRRLTACILIWQHLPSDQQRREKTDRAKPAAGVRAMKTTRRERGGEIIIKKKSLSNSAKGNRLSTEGSGGFLQPRE